jgi:hypothetical protein
MIGNAMNKSNVTVRGIVVAGNSRAEAEDNYRAVATGESVKVLEDKENNFIFLSNADSTVILMNPLTGAVNLSQSSDDTVSQMEFLSSDTDKVIDTFYTVCSEGCGTHLIADDPELMKRCALCGDELKELDEETLESFAHSDEEAEEGDFTNEPNAITVCGTSREEAESKFRKLAEHEVNAAAYDCEHGLVVSPEGEEFSYSPYTGESSTIIADEEGIQLSVEASGDDSSDYDAHWYVCAGSGCGKHIVTSSESSVFCPVCSSGIMEPEEEVLSSEDELDEDVSADEIVAGDSCDELDEDVSADEIVAGDSCDDCGSKPCECEESDEEEEEDDDDDDDDEDDDDEDDDDDSEDDDNTLSISSVTIEEETAEEEAQASESEETEGEETTVNTDGNSGKESAKQEETTMTTIATDLLSLASAKGEMDHSKLEVAYAGNVNGQLTWLAFYEGSPVATASAKDAGDKADIFSSPVYGNLVLASAKENGVTAALTELNFKAVATTVEVDTYVQDEITARVDDLVSESSDKYSQESADFSERFLAAIATAASGMNKNFFKDVTNPVKGALVNTLNSLGIQNSEKMVAKAFASKNEEYLNNLVVKANEIMEFDVSVQNQLTEAVSSAAEEQTVEASTTAYLPIGKPVESYKARVQPSAVKPQAVEASSHSELGMEYILSTLNKRR